jgi:hypothetical protein
VIGQVPNRLDLRSEISQAELNSPKILDFPAELSPSLQLHYRTKRFGAFQIYLRLGNNEAQDAHLY